MEEKGVHGNNRVFTPCSLAGFPSGGTVQVQEEVGLLLKRSLGRGGEDRIRAGSELGLCQPPQSQEAVTLPARVRYCALFLTPQTNIRFISAFLRSHSQGSQGVLKG